MTKDKYIIGDVYRVYGDEITILNFLPNCSGYREGHVNGGKCTGCPGRLVYKWRNILKSVCGYREGNRLHTHVKSNNVEVRTNSRW